MQHKWDIWDDSPGICTKCKVLLMRWLRLLMIGDLCFLVVLSCHSQVSTSASPSLSEKEAEVRYFYDLCYQLYLKEQHDSVVVYADQGIALAQRYDLLFLEALITEEKALSLEFLDIDKSIAVYLEALEAYKRAGKEDWIDEVKFEGVGNAHTILIRMYARRGEMANAMHHYDLIEGLVREDQYYTRMSMYESMAFAQAFAGDYKEAIKYFKQSLDLSARAGESSGVVIRGTEENYALIASYYNSLGNIDSALHFINIAQEVATDTLRSRIRGRAMVDRISGKIYLASDQVPAAQVRLERGLDEYQRMGDVAEISRTAADLAECYRRQGRLERAAAMAQKAYDTATESSDLVALQQSLISLNKIYETIGDVTSGWATSQQLLQVNDSLVSRQNAMLSEAFAKRYETTEKENQINLQNVRIAQQRTFIWAASLISALLLGLVFLGYRTAVHRKRANRLLEKQRDQLAELDKAKSRFFANISHELKTPLTLILAPLQSAIEKSGNKQIQKEIELAHRNGSKLLALVDEVMDLSKLENGKLSVKTTSVNFHQLVRRIVGAFLSLSQIREIDLKLDYYLSEDAMAVIDVEKFEKILNNLISNAIKFTTSHGSVIVTVNSHPSDDKMTLIKVADTGEGISDEDQEKIFEPYFQRTSSSEVRGGTGLGLALVTELTRLLNGSIELYSKVGEGSTFSLSLPLSLSIKTGSGKEAEADETSGSAPNLYVPKTQFEDLPKLLIIEDDKEMSDYLKEILSPHYQCTVAYNGEQGLNALSQQHFDCVTCDVMMPEMDGFQFIKRLRSQEMYQRTPVMMLTARALEADVLKGFALGVDDYVPKPFSKNEVIARINALITNKRARDLWRSEEKAEEEQVASFEVEQLKSAETFVLAHLEKQDLKVQDLAAHMNYSHRQLTRIIKKLTGLSPANFIKEIRLQKAHFLISRRQFATIAEVRHEVGFQNASYFSKAFLERFGVRPGEL